MKQKLYKLNDRGAALIAGLLILVVLSILSVTTMQSSLLQERMAGNMQQRDIAFQLAEAALRDGENFVEFTSLLPTAFTNTGGTGGLYTPSATAPRWQTINWATGSIQYDDSVDNLGTLIDGELPRYIVEFLTSVAADEEDSLSFSPIDGSGARMFRITARGVSSNGRSVVILQSTYKR